MLMFWASTPPVPPKLTFRARGNIPSQILWEFHQTIPGMRPLRIFHPPGLPLYSRISLPAFVATNTMSIRPFKSDKELVKFARAFFRNHVESFNKDIAICMTRDAHGHHAYFPALITCIAFADLISGLHAGTLRHQTLRELKQYAQKFMKAEYTSDPRRLDILYKFLRHKIAHLAHPYPVDTVTKQTVPGQPRRRVTWTVYASKRRPAIEVVDFTTQQFLSKTVRPWPVSYNCRIKVSIRSFQIDIVRSISGYLRHLQLDRKAREHFAKCMIEYFPP